MFIGYKEWSLVCEALGAGAQTILLRKGGISEAKGGFAYSYPEFYLLPTLFHQQELSVNWRSTHEPARTESGAWIIRYKAEMISKIVLKDWDQVLALRPYHIWKESVLQERFAYKESHQIHFALIRVKKCSSPILLPDTPALGGCKSWLECEDQKDQQEAAEPVINEEEFRIIRKELETLIT